ncbi:hypothetical protein [Sphingobacterium micropteri]|nr:hypothetical protein [Sphingobacterium micropteri]
MIMFFPIQSAKAYIQAQGNYKEEQFVNRMKNKKKKDRSLN